ncbi:MAG: hypothetical protein ACRD3G_20475 [Vicinamibacterales bacterium]
MEGEQQKQRQPKRRTSQRQAVIRYDGTEKNHTKNAEAAPFAEVVARHAAVGEPKHNRRYAQADQYVNCEVSCAP